MKACAICGRTTDDVAATCSACGEASWLAIETPASEQAPSADIEPSTEPRTYQAPRRSRR